MESKCTVPVYDFFPSKLYKKTPMKKTIPFDVDKARAGAKVVTNTGQEVTILTYEGRDNARPIIGTFMHAEYVKGKGYNEAEEILDRWPIDGKSIHPGGFDLMIEEEVSEVDYEDEENPVVLMTRHEWQRFRERTELLEVENKGLGEESHKKILTIDDLNDRLKHEQELTTKLYRKNKELYHWKEAQIKLWAPVISFIEIHPGKLKVGGSVAGEVLRRLRIFHDVFQT